VFNATFYNISAISWWSVLLVEQTKVPGEGQTLLLNAILSKLRLKINRKPIWNSHLITTKYNNKQKQTYNTFLREVMISMSLSCVYFYFLRETGNGNYHDLKSELKFHSWQSLQYYRDHIWGRFARRSRLWRLTSLSCWSVAKFKSPYNFEELCSVFTVPDCITFPMSAYLFVTDQNDSFFKLKWNTFQENHFQNNGYDRFQ
jgi:hypothetical protein